MNYHTFTINLRHIYEMLVSRALFREIENWPELLADYFGLSHSKELTLKFGAGYILTIRANSDDKWPVHEIFMRDDYRLRQLKPNLKHIVDLGAYTGDFAIQAARLNPNAKIVSLEPSSENYRYLVNNIKQNDLKKRIKTLKYACAPINGQLNFYLSINRGGHSLVGKNAEYRVKVKSLTLMDVLKRAKFKNCDLLKIDIEGGEYDLLYKLSPSKFKKFKFISMEYHNTDEKGKNGKSLANFLEKQGYKVEFHDSYGKSVGQLFAKRKVK